MSETLCQQLEKRYDFCLRDFQFKDSNDSFLIDCKGFILISLFIIMGFICLWFATQVSSMVKTASSFQAHHKWKRDLENVWEWTCFLVVGIIVFSCDG